MVVGVLERSAPNLELNAGSASGITGRRVLFVTLVVATIAALLALAGKALSAGGFTAMDGLLLVLFGCTLPWSVIGFWNATIGFFIMRFARDPVATVLPIAARVPADAPIVASTATNLIVFLPFIYMQGEMRAYYVPLAIVVALSQVASMVVGFTFIPAVAARLLARRARSGAPEVGAAAAPPPIHTRFYAATIGWTLRHPWVTVALAAGLFGGSTYLFDRYVTRGRVFGGGFGTEEHITIAIALPRGSDLERTDQLTRFFEEKIAPIREVETWTARVGEQTVHAE